MWAQSPPRCLCRGLGAPSSRLLTIRSRPLALGSHLVVLDPDSGGWGAARAPWVDPGCVAATSLPKELAFMFSGFRFSSASQAPPQTVGDALGGTRGGAGPLQGHL